jgi:hypothetical protein
MAGSHTNDLPTPTDQTDNTHWKKTPLLFWGESKIGVHGMVDRLGPRPGANIETS